ncbi:hypothetical protein [Vulgatibacter incomptus]|uniref:Uncharacterized protein n=1 Tax=Vulgatibacter incomptus TaxID=1391653 RepID=A0A0K1P9Q9_9BACT|nr:hypothetical protein [Vulgatibacter incomptus]AKU89849.1 hypothetical protein AKJ08_0236 [Vulgatibacter incomptus]
MKTFLLMSMIWVTFALPLLAARNADPRQGARRMSVVFAFSTLLYFLYVAYGHTRFYVPF